MKRRYMVAYAIRVGVLDWVGDKHKSRSGLATTVL
jgi:hypothetical protein